MNLARASKLLAPILAVAVMGGLATLVARHPARHAAPPAAEAAAPAPAPAPATAPAHTFGRVDAALAYRAIVAPVNAAQAEFLAALTRWGPTTPPAVAVADAQPLRRALTRVDGQLAELARTYPQAWDAVASTAEAAGAVRQDLDLLPGLDVPGSGWTAPAWTAEYAGDVAHLTAVADGLRALLGLPPTGQLTPVSQTACVSGPSPAGPAQSAPGRTC